MSTHQFSRSQPLEVRFSPFTDLVHPSFAFAGLADLAAQGFLDLAVDTSLWPISGRPRHPFVARFAVRFSERGPEWHDIAIDFHDKSDFFCAETLARVAVYFKANLNSEVSPAAAGEFADKLRPFGPYFGCAPVFDTLLPPRVLGSARAAERRHNREASRPDPVWLARHLIRRLRRYRARGPYPVYESEPMRGEPPPHGDEPWVFFQSSTWPEHPELNAYRLDLITSLRSHFGPRFFGGFSDTDFARSRYPEVVVPHIPQEQYSRVRNAIPIEINTRGLYDCFSWRLLESIASSRAIVSQPQHCVTRFELGPANGVLVGAAVESVVAQLDTLVGNWDAVVQMSDGAHRLYTQSLRPPAKLKTVLLEAESAIYGDVQTR